MSLETKNREQKEGEIYVLREGLGIELFDQQISEHFSQDDVYISYLGFPFSWRSDEEIARSGKTRNELEERGISTIYNFTEFGISEHDFSLILRCIRGEKWFVVALYSSPDHTFIKYLALFGVFPATRPDYSRMKFSCAGYESFSNHASIPFEFVNYKEKKSRLTCKFQVIGRSAFLLISQLDTKYNTLHIAVDKEFVRLVKVAKRKYLPTILKKIIKFPLGTKMRYHKMSVVCRFEEESVKQKLIIKLYHMHECKCCSEKVVCVSSSPLYSSFVVCYHAILRCDLHFLCGQYRLTTHKLTKQTLKEIKMLEQHRYMYPMSLSLPSGTQT